MKKIKVVASDPYISITKASKEAVETLGGNFVTKNGVSYGLFFIKVEPTEKIIIKAVKLYEVLKSDNQFSPFVIKGELLGQLINSTKSKVEGKNHEKEQANKILCR